MTSLVHWNLLYAAACIAPDIEKGLYTEIPKYIDQSRFTKIFMDPTFTSTIRTDVHINLAPPSMVTMNQTGRDMIQAFRQQSTLIRASISRANTSIVQVVDQLADEVTTLLTRLNRRTTPSGVIIRKHFVRLHMRTLRIRRLLDPENVEAQQQPTDPAAADIITMTRAEANSYDDDTYVDDVHERYY